MHICLSEQASQTIGMSDWLRILFYDFLLNVVSLVFLTAFSMTSFCLCGAHVLTRWSMLRERHVMRSSPPMDTVEGCGWKLAK
jgi:hypothetical protein